MTNYQVALKLIKGERVPLDQIKDAEGVVDHLEAFRAQCVGIINTLKRGENANR